MSETQPAASDRSPKRRWLRVVRYAAMLLLIGLLAGELLARYYLGLGDPPLTITHPTIEYLFAPNQHLRRFGNRFETNSYSMRSREFPREKEDPRELRILVLGDSIINGGSLTDQGELATELLHEDLSDRLDRPVVVANISAGSWGPPNLLAYVKEFGTFDADIAVFVLSSHDATDVPTFEPLDDDAYPRAKPPGALWEAVTRYLPRYLPGGSTSVDEAPPAVGDTRGDAALTAVESLIRIFQQTGARVIVVQHQTRAELVARPAAGHERLADVCARAGAEVIQLGPSFHESIELGVDPYRDDGLHPNVAGQRLIYETLRQAVRREIDDPP